MAITKRCARRLTRVEMVFRRAVADENSILYTTSDLNYPYYLRIIRDKEFPLTGVVSDYVPQFLEFVREMIRSDNKLPS